MLPFANAAQGVSTFSRRPVSLSNQAANSRVVNHDPPIERKNAFSASTGPCPGNPTFAITGLAPSTCTLLAFLDSFSRVSFFFRNTAFSSILFQQKRESFEFWSEGRKSCEKRILNSWKLCDEYWWMSFLFF